MVAHKYGKATSHNMTLRSSKGWRESPPVNHQVALGCTTELVYNLFIFHKLNLNAPLTYDTQEMLKREINTKESNFVVSDWVSKCNNKSLYDKLCSCFRKLMSACVEAYHPH